MNKRHTHILIIATITVMLFCSCTSENRSDGRHLSTKTLKEGLYLERYKMAEGGVFASDTYGYYLTDSNQFLRFIGFLGENEDFDYQLIGDSIVIFNVISDEVSIDNLIRKRRYKLPTK